MCTWVGMDGVRSMDVCLPCLCPLHAGLRPHPARAVLRGHLPCVQIEGFPGYLQRVEVYASGRHCTTQRQGTHVLPPVCLSLAFPWAARAARGRRAGGQGQEVEKDDDVGGVPVRAWFRWVGGCGCRVGHGRPEHGPTRCLSSPHLDTHRERREPSGPAPYPTRQDTCSVKGGGAWVSVGRGREVGLGVTPPSCNAQRSRRRGLKTDSKRGACPTPRTFFFHTTWVHQAPPCTPWPRSSR